MLRVIISRAEVNQRLSGNGVDLLFRIDSLPYANGQIMPPKMYVCMVSELTQLTPDATMAGDNYKINSK